MKERTTIDLEDLGTLCICALRYCQGRETYMPSLVQGICRGFLRDLSDKDLGVMIEDCSHQRRMELYGDPVIDRPGWLQWEADLMAERKRRNGKNKR